MKSATTDFIIRDDNGQFVAAGAKRVGSSSVPTIEVAVLREGLLKAREKHIKKVMVEGDSMLVIDCINGTCATPLGDSRQWFKTLNKYANVLRAALFNMFFEKLTSQQIPLQTWVT
ncbi:hypothetical protein ACLB2K_024114 [Fragaria x ananassa]